MFILLQQLLKHSFDGLNVMKEPYCQNYFFTFLQDYTGRNRKRVSCNDSSNLLLEKRLLLSSSNEDLYFYFLFPFTKQVSNPLIRESHLLLMSFLGESHGNPVPLSTSNEDFLIREIVLTHDPDDRYQIDSEMLLNLVETTFCYTTENVFDPQMDAVDPSDIDLTGSLEEPVSRVIYKISNEILCLCFEDDNLHRKTLVLLEMLGHYRWDAKVVLALASLAHSFALFWLILQLEPDNALATSLAIVKQLPSAIRILKPKFKALNLLVNTMLKLTKIIMSFESASLQHELVDDQAMNITKSMIYTATYWIFRSIFVCSSQIADLRNLSLEQVYSDRTVVAAWGLHSLGNKLNSLCHDLGEYVDNCQNQIETRLYQKLLSMFKEKQADNQNALKTLFASQNEFSFKNSSTRDKIGILELKSKIVLLVISRPDLLPIDKTFFLVQQTSDPRQQTSCTTLWVPIPATCKWSLADKTSFEFFSNRLPWFSVRRPWSLNPAVINYIRQEWNFNEDPIMVVLNEDGLVTNSNAMDMVGIWGPKAFPFSASREKQLWEQANWTIDLISNGISPLLSEWVKEDKNLCIYGSDNLDWIKQFQDGIKKIKTSGIQLEMAYVGCKNPGDNVKTIINRIDQENLSTSLTLNKVNLFWYRLETIKRSISHQDHTTGCDEIGAKVAELLEFSSNDGWAVIGTGSSRDVLKLDQERLTKCIDLFPLWRKNVAEMGLVGAIRAALELPVDGGKCQHDEVIPYEEGLIEKTLICGSCKRPVEKFVLYKCDE